MKRIINKIGCAFSCLPLVAQASFIESSIGTAVVNDATASYYNPAALVLVKNPQLIPQATFAYFRTQFNGQFTPAFTSMAETGHSGSNTNYYSPSFYVGMPLTDHVVIGLAVVSNSATRDTDDNSILRYVQASNNITDYDVVPALALKINNLLSIGGGVNFSYANFDLHPIVGIPGLNIPDSQSHNQSDGTGMGGNIGFLLKPTPVTLVGFNYRSITTYRLSGKSVFNGTPHIVSNHYHFKSKTPARSALSINHFVTKQLGFIATVQRIQWSAITNLHVNNIATLTSAGPAIVNGSVPYYLRDTWVFTLGSHYRVNPEWILRVAGTYNQAPGNPHYQIANGDTVILGVSTGYKLNKTFTIDGSYAHGFIQNETINIRSTRFLISGTNQAWRDAISLKLTINL